VRRWLTCRLCRARHRAGRAHYAAVRACADGRRAERSRVVDDVAPPHKTPTAQPWHCAATWASFSIARIFVRCDGHARHADHHDRHARGGEHLARHEGHRRACRPRDHLAERLGRETELLLSRSRSQLDRAQGRVSADAARHLRSAEAEMDDARQRLQTRPARTLAAADRRLDALAAHTRALDPARVLARGWSITRSADGRAVRSVHDVEPGTELRTIVADGTIASTITGTEPTTEQD
jgi:exonuclease VII large subunit